MAANQVSSATRQINLAIVCGDLTSEPMRRMLPSGSEVVSLEVRIKPEDGPAETVPVAWFDAPSWAAGLAAGDGVVVTGRVRRRFFRVGQSTQSRTEVLAANVARTSQRSRVTKLIAEAARQLGSSG
jgi:single-stranded DNA-binding protein